MFCPIINGKCKDAECRFFHLGYEPLYEGFCKMAGGFTGLGSIRYLKDGIQDIADSIDTFNNIFSSSELGEYLEAIGGIGRDISEGLSNLGETIKTE